MKEFVILDYVNSGYDLVKLVTGYSDQMKEIEKGFGGSFSDIPPGHKEYWELQQKLQLAHVLNKDGQLPSLPVVEPVKEMKEETPAEKFAREIKENAEKLAAEEVMKDTVDAK